MLNLKGRIEQTRSNDFMKIAMVMFDLDCVVNQRNMGGLHPGDGAQEICCIRDTGGAVDVRY